jgi:hypothetical protein
MSTPASISGLQDWWTTGTPGAPSRVYSDLGATIVNTDAQQVEQWIGVNGGTFTQGSTANRPKWDANLGAIIQENGASQYMNITGATISRRAFTEFFVIECLTLRNSWDGTSQSAHHLIDVHGGNANPLNIYYDRGGKLTTYDGTTVQQDTSAKLHSSRILLVVVGDASSASIIVNGQTVVQTTLAAANMILSEILADSVASEPMNGAIYDFGYYNVALQSTDLATLLTWAQTSRGVQSTYLSNTVFDGDSLSVGAGASDQQPMNRNYSNQMGIPLAHRRTLIAEGGLALATMVTEAATLCDPWIVGGITNVNTIWAGTNDFAVNSQTEASVLANIKTYCAARKTAGFAKVICMGMLPRPTVNTFTQVNLTNYNADMRTAFDGATLGADAFVDLYADPNIGGVIGGNNTGPNYSTADNTHLNNLGNAIVANLVYPFWAPLTGVTASSYTMTGPVTGTAGTASGVFTCQLVGGCTFNGTQSVKVTCPPGVTCNVTAPGGTISGNGTGAVTITPAAGQTGFTYTLSSTGSGAKRISFNGYSGLTLGTSGTPVNRGWTDASNLNINFTAKGNPLAENTGTGGYAARAMQIAPPVIRIGVK